MFAPERAVANPTGKTFVNSLGMRMIGLEGGSFDAWTPSLARYGEMMGKSGRADLAFALNRPRVTIPVTVGDFFLAEFPVTNGMYRQFVKQTSHRRPEGKLVDFFWKRSRASPWDLEDFKGDDLPVTGVQNADIIAFCKWLSQKEGRQYRAPTIHEFEYANRAGTDTRFWWGDRPDVRTMNFGPSLINHPVEVGSYPPNPWDFYGMHGNVWEYCPQRLPWDESRFQAMGGAFNCPQKWTGIDAFGNFHEGPQKMRLLTSSFRLACEADQGAARPGDRQKPTIVAAAGRDRAFPKLKITVGERIAFGLSTGPPYNITSFFVTREGTWIVKNRRSTDRGKTWKACTHIGETRCQLRDGTIISIHGPESGGARAGFDHMEGKAQLKMLVSTDDWKTVERFQASIYVPLADFFVPVRGIIELEDGRLLATMYGRMDGDHVREDSPVGYELDAPWIKTRVILIESKDRGRSWRYLSTVSYNPHLGFEGQNESDIIRLPDGKLAVFMRTGIHGYADLHGRENLDQPLLMAWSADEGRTWTEPQRIHVGDRLITGIYPRALLTSQGVLAVLRCRPDGSVIFSPDGHGAFWSDEHVHYLPKGHEASDGAHAGMQDMALIGPDTILVVDLFNKLGSWYIAGVPVTVTKESRRDGR